jgi:hypothetical protein
MHSSVALQREILCRDLDADFMEGLSTEIAWQYYLLYRKLKSDPGLTQDYRQEEYSRQRGYAAVTAMQRVAKNYRIPSEFIRLECNGQSKLLLKVGRVILIQESVLTLEDEPKAADYKIQLAELHGSVRQLELTLGDKINQVRDWSGCVLGVLLHGPAGPNFTERHKVLGSLMIGVTDAAYGQWVIRVDLHKLAMFGHAALVPSVDQDVGQPDNVTVTRKRKNIGQVDST